eukprot:1182886-Amphidinium_carterae.1
MHGLAELVVEADKAAREAVEARVTSQMQSYKQYRSALVTLNACTARAETIGLKAAHFFLSHRQPMNVHDVLLHRSSNGMILAREEATHGMWGMKRTRKFQKCHAPAAVTAFLI